MEAQKPPLYIPFGNFDRELCIIKAKGAPENFYEYFKKLVYDENVIQILKSDYEELEKMGTANPEFLEMLENDPEQLAEESYRRFMSSLNNIGYVSMGVRRNRSSWVLHRTHDSDIYHFILIGDDWKYSIIDDIDFYKQEMEDVITKDIGLDIINEHDHTVA